MTPRTYALGPLLSLLTFVLLLFAPLESRAQEAEQAALQEAFAAGDARTVLDGATGRVEVSLFGESSQYSRSQAVYVLQDFFENYPPRRFAWQDSSESGQNRFLTGRYWHSGKKQPLRVHLRLRRGGESSGWQLQDVRIERR